MSMDAKILLKKKLLPYFKDRIKDNIFINNIENNI